jgi:hypothetical protein
MTGTGKLPFSCRLVQPIASDPLSAIPDEAMHDR